MKPLSKLANQVLYTISRQHYQKIQKSSGFMPVVVEEVGTIDGVTGTGRIISVAHYYEQYGDLMADPEMTFLESQNPATGKTIYYPMSFTQHGSIAMYRESVTIGENGQIQGYRPRMQADQASFANQWMKNIKAQQGLELIIEEK